MAMRAQEIDRSLVGDFTFPQAAPSNAPTTRPAIDRESDSTCHEFQMM